MSAILVIEDDLTFSRILEGFLNKQGFKVKVAHKGVTGLQLFSSNHFDLVLLDYRLPDMTGIDVLVDIKKSNPTTQAIIMTSFSDIRTAVKAIQVGAFEYITKPVNPDELVMIVNQALAQRANSPELAVVKPSAARKFVEGSSPMAKQLYEHVCLVAPTNMSVIIEGESGTGKENVAQAIHRLSTRSKAKFVAVDCGALSMELAGSELFGHVRGSFTGAIHDKLGQFNEADQGTLFLDEVGNLSLDIQVKLLRALQERVIQPLGSNKEINVDVRIITATNEDLFERVRSGSFREDLYHRLNEFKLKVPAVRERYDDLDEFLHFFRELANQELSRSITGFSDEVAEIFRSYDWPGNLREMKNVVKRAVLLTSEGLVSVQALPAEMLSIAHGTRNAPLKQVPVHDLKTANDAREKEMIIKTLTEVRYNKSKAARILNIDRKTLYSKMEKYGIE